MYSYHNDRPIFPSSVEMFEETIYDVNRNAELHVLLDTLGVDGEPALRPVRQARSRYRKLVVAVPNQAKSAGTLLALGADQILMWSTSDLGPVDPNASTEGNTLQPKQ